MTPAAASVETATESRTATIQAAAASPADTGIIGAIGHGRTTDRTLAPCRGELIAATGRLAAWVRM